MCGVDREKPQGFEEKGCCSCGETFETKEDWLISGTEASDMPTLWKAKPFIHGLLI